MGRPTHRNATHGATHALRVGLLLAVLALAMGACEGEDARNRKSEPRTEVSTSNPRPQRNPIEDLHRKLRREPDNPQHWTALALAEIGQGANPDKALAHALTAATLADDPNALIVGAKLLQNTGKSKAALEFYRAVVAHFPDHPIAPQAAVQIARLQRSHYVGRFAADLEFIRGTREAAEALARIEANSPFPAERLRARGARYRYLYETEPLSDENRRAERRVLEALLATEKLPPGERRRIEQRLSELDELDLLAKQEAYHRAHRRCLLDPGAESFRALYEAAQALPQPRHPHLLERYVERHPQDRAARALLNQWLGRDESEAP